MGVNISAKFTKDTRPLNGLEALAELLLDKPYEEHYVICKVRHGFKKVNYRDGGTEIPTVDFVHIEPMQSEKEIKDAKKLFDAACKARLGELPQQTLFEDAKKDKGDEGGEPQ